MKEHSESEKNEQKKEKKRGKRNKHNRTQSFDVHLLTMVAVTVMVLDVSSKWLSTLNAHRLHSIAKVIESMWQPVVVCVSCAFVVVAAELSMQNRYRVYPVCGVWHNVNMRIIIIIRASE